MLIEASCYIAENKPMQGRLQILRSLTSYGLEGQQVILWDVLVLLLHQSARFMLYLLFFLASINVNSVIVSFFSRSMMC